MVVGEQLVSIIVPCYGNTELLLQTLSSILIQDYHSIELIITDDGSKNFDADLVSCYLNKNAGDNIKMNQIIVNEENVGTVKNINNAIKKSSGEYIKIIAGDDVFPNEKIVSRQINLLKSSSSYLVLGNIVECDSQLNEKEEIGFSTYYTGNIVSNKEKQLQLFFKDARVFSTQSCCFRKKYFDEYAYFDERFRLVEDLPMALKIINSNVRFDYDATPSVLHRGGTGVSTSNKLFDKNKINYYIDLYNVYNLIILPQIELFGNKSYFTMRRNICKYRVRMCLEDNNVKRMFVTIRYSYDLLRYILTSNRMLSRFFKR